MGAQRDRARASSEVQGAPAPSRCREFDDKFLGYDQTESPAKVLHLTDEALAPVKTLETGATGGVMLDQTPFYVEAGGQVSDRGRLTWSGGEATVNDVSKKFGKTRIHLVTVEKGALHVGDAVTATVDATTRDATRRHHTATHLLHAALRQRLGTHVRQAGSLVAPDRLRFDFAHFQPLTEDERRDIERDRQRTGLSQHAREHRCPRHRRRDEIGRDGAVRREVRRQACAWSRVGGFSIELCGGTHVRATGDIGPFVITEEAGVAAGVRRIEALTGAGAVDYLQQREASLGRTLAALGVPADQAADAVGRLQAEAKRLARENEQLKMKLALGGGASGGGSAAADDAVAIGDAKLITRRVSGLEKAALRGLSDSLRDRAVRGVVVLAAENDGKVQLLVSVTKDLTDRVKAGAARERTRADRRRWRRRPSGFRGSRRQGRVEDRRAAREGGGVGPSSARSPIGLGLRAQGPGPRAYLILYPKVILKRVQLADRAAVERVVGAGQAERVSHVETPPRRDLHVAADDDSPGDAFHRVFDV